MPKLTDLTSILATAPDDGDLMHIVDISDISEDPAGSSKKITNINLLAKTVYLAGRSGGQTVNGGTAASENLVLDSTSNATKGEVQIAAGSDLLVNETIITNEISELTPDAGVSITVSGNTGSFYDYPTPHGTWFTFSATGVPDDGSNIYVPYDPTDDWWFGFGMGATDQFNFGSNGTEITMTGNGLLTATRFAGIADTTQTLIAADTIPSDNDVVLIQGSGGPVTLTSNPQIADGVANQKMTLVGNSDANPVTVVNGNGLALNNGQSFTFGLNDTMQIIYINNDWIELSRSDN